MQAGEARLDDVGVTVAACPGRVRKAGISFNPFVCLQPVRSRGVTPVTFVAADVAMNVGFKELRIHKDLFVRSQLLHLAASAFAL